MQSVIDRPPPPVLDLQRGGGGESWVRLFRAANDIEAHLLAGRLSAVGVETYAVKDRATADAWLHNGSDPWTPVDLWVRSHQFEDAQCVLAEIAFDQPARLPATALRKDWRLPVFWWTTALALALAFTGIALSRTADYLDRCGFSSDCEVADARP